MDSLSAQAQAQIQANFDAASATTKAQIAAHTGIDVNSQRVQQGASSALSLLQHGYNPDSTSDSANLIHAIAGGCALIPGGAIFGAYIELLWQVGQVIACPVEQAFASVGLGSPSPACGGQPCRSSGNWTASGILASTSLPRGWNTTGSFSSLVIGALATYAAKSLNCKGGVPPGVVVDACVAMWNTTHSGSPVEVWIPPLGADVGGMSTSALIAGQGVSVTGNTPSAQAGQDPNIYYAFQSVSAIELSAGAFAAPYPGGETWRPFMVMGAPPGIAWTEPRVVSLNGGPLFFLTQEQLAAITIAIVQAQERQAAFEIAIRQAQLRQAAAERTTAILVGGGAIVAAAAGGSLYAVATGQAVVPFWMGLWGKVAEGGAKALRAVGVRV